MKVAVVKETCPGELRVAMVPSIPPSLTKAGYEVVVERGAGVAAGYPDETYTDKGATLIDSRDQAFEADIVLQVRAAGANAGQDDSGRMRLGQVIIGMCDPLGAADKARDLAGTGATLFGLELIPRITRAQSMDVLSSMATVAGYRAVLLAAAELPKMFPLMMTAAGTLKPARAFVIGAGVAGLQAIATAKRLGAIVQAYDVRPVVREQVESLGGKFVELELEAGGSEDKGGYAKAMGDEFYEKQRAFMADICAESDVVISTAAIPGRQSPLLITENAVERMQPGTVIVDLAAERGGNCCLSQPDEKVVQHGVTILGPTNLPAEVPYHASQMYAKNMATFLLNMTKDGKLHLDMGDEIVADTLVFQGGELFNERMRSIVGLEPLNPPEPEPQPESEENTSDAANEESKS
ncbi:MAG: Re/Si-specific NAD(P)(+) transhydrogenase subunit alpha [Planctomycetota bacterium]